MLTARLLRLEHLAACLHLTIFLPTLSPPSYTSLPLGRPTPGRPQVHPPSGSSSSLGGARAAVTELARACLGRTITTPGLKSDSSDELMEDGSPAEAPAGTAGGSSAAAPGDGIPAAPEVGLAAGSPLGVGPVTPQTSLSLWIYPNWPKYLAGFTGKCFSRIREGMPQVRRRIKEKFSRGIGFPVGLTTDRYAFLDERKAGSLGGTRSTLSSRTTCGLGCSTLKPPWKTQKAAWSAAASLSAALLILQQRRGSACTSSSS